MIELREYIDSGGRSPFGRWFDSLNAVAAARVTTALTRMRFGNFSNVKPVGEGVSEFRIDFGPGYRIYFGQHGEQLILLLTGGTKKGQANDIARAKASWKEFKQRRP